MGAGVNSRIGTRLPGPKLGNRPTRNSPPVLSNFLSLDGDFNNSLEGQYLMRTLPLDQLDNDRQNAARALSGLRNEVTNLEQTGASAGGMPVVPIRSGLTTTGHPVQFQSTGSYFPGGR